MLIKLVIYSKKQICKDPINYCKVADILILQWEVVLN